MGIQTWIKGRREKKEFEKAVEKGKQLQKEGKVIVPTTGGMVEVKKDSPLAKGYRRPGASGGGGSQQPAPSELYQSISETELKKAEARAAAEQTALRIAEERRQLEEFKKMSKKEQEKYVRTAAQESQLRDLEKKGYQKLDPKFRGIKEARDARQEAQITKTEVKKDFDLKQYAVDYGVSQEEIDVYKDWRFTRGEERYLALLSKQTQMSFSPEAQKELVSERRMQKVEKSITPYGKELLTGKTLFGTYEEAQKEDTPFLTKSVKGGIGLVKGVVYAPITAVEKVLKGSSKELYKLEEKTGSATLGYSAATLGVASQFVPSTPVKHAGLYVGYKAFQFAGPVGKAFLAGHGIFGLTKAETKEAQVFSVAEIGMGTGGAALKSIRAGRALISPKKATRTTFEPIPDAPLRPRATVILKDIRTGKILYQIDKPTGTYMLPGGAIETKELPKTAARRELFEETGLKDIKLTQKDIIKTPEQKHYVFEALVKKADIQKLMKAQASEVAGFKWIRPSKYTGPTMLEPYGRVPSRLNVFEKRIVRAEDLYVGAKSIYPGLKQKVLTIKLPKETFIRRGQAVFLTRRVGKYSLARLRGYKPGQFRKFQTTGGILAGFGSRYDIPFSKLKPYYGKKLTYIHGTPGKIQTEMTIESKGVPKKFGQLSSKEKFAIKAEFLKRGQEGFYFQPPTSADPTSPAYLGLTYLGIYKKVKPTYEMGVKLRTKSPGIYRYEAELGKDIISTRKAKRGKEFEAIAEVGKEFQISSTDYTYIGGRKVRIVDIKTGKPTPSQQRKLSRQLREQKETQYYYETGKRPVTVSETLMYATPSKIVFGKSYTVPKTEKIPKEYTQRYKGTKYKTSPEPYKALPEKIKVPTDYKTYGYGYKAKTKIERYGGGETYRTPPPTKPPKSTANLLRVFPKSKRVGRTPKYKVELRRYGKFRVVGTGLTLRKAFELGRGKAARTLGATFRVRGARGTGIRYKTPKGFYKKVTPKEGTIFIEKTKFRLSKTPEVKEIQAARRRKK